MRNTSAQKAESRRQKADRTGDCLLPTAYCLLSRRQGQALLELAVFGSLMLMVLGAVVNYGLNADANQRAMMLSFRQALSSAATANSQNTPTSSSHLVLHDQHFPDPSNPFAIGSMIPASASSGGINRSNMLGRVFPDTADELPRISFDVSGLAPGNVVRCGAASSGCTAAGLRADDVPTDSIVRYREVFGNICDCDDQNSTLCTGHPMCAGQRASGQHRLLIVDSCDGEILNYDGCVRQARLIAEPAFCQRECERGGGEDCAGICAKPMNVPWYAQDGKYDDTAHRWIFKALDRVFLDIPGKSLGIQVGAVKGVALDSALMRGEIGKDEDPNHQGQPSTQRPAIATHTAVDWTEFTQRTLIYHHGGTARVIAPVDTSMNRQQRTVWTTEWDK